jgi:hypothetical protein
MKAAKGDCSNFILHEAGWARTLPGRVQGRKNLILPARKGAMEVKMAQFVVFVGIYWLAAATSMEMGYGEEAVWASIIPAVWLFSLVMLRNMDGSS